jgi:hypothetical protein
MLVVDLMHEFELGVWKALFIHLLRILQAYDKSLLVELDRRCVIPRYHDINPLNIVLSASDKYPLLAETLSDDFLQISLN